MLRAARGMLEWASEGDKGTRAGVAFGEAIAADEVESQGIQLWQRDPLRGVGLMA
jgi:hypothetical protein